MGVSLFIEIFIQFCMNHYCIIQLNIKFIMRDKSIKLFNIFVCYYNYKPLVYIKRSNDRFLLLIYFFSYVFCGRYSPNIYDSLIKIFEDF
jgi:hypothetical protein